jgi:hypothetical protein
LDEPNGLTGARERAAQAKTRGLAAHRRAEGVHESAAKTLERLGRLDLAQVAWERAQRARAWHAKALREEAQGDKRATGQDGEQGRNRTNVS